MWSLQVLRCPSSFAVPPHSLSQPHEIPPFKFPVTITTEVISDEFRRPDIREISADVWVGVRLRGRGGVAGRGAAGRSCAGGGWRSCAGVVVGGVGVGERVGVGKGLGQG